MAADRHGCCSRPARTRDSSGDGAARAGPPPAAVCPSTPGRLSTARTRTRPVSGRPCAATTPWRGEAHAVNGFRHERADAPRIASGWASDAGEPYDGARRSRRPSASSPSTVRPSTRTVSSTRCALAVSARRARRAGIDRPTRDRGAALYRRLKAADRGRRALPGDGTWRPWPTFRARDARRLARPAAVEPLAERARPSSATPCAARPSGPSRRRARWPRPGRAPSAIAARSGGALDRAPARAPSAAEAGELLGPAASRPRSAR